jgi:hypothetical protein
MVKEIKKFKKVVNPVNKKQTTPSELSPRNWKFWVMVALTVGWCVLLYLYVTFNATKPTMAHWWKAQIQTDKKIDPLKISLHPAKKNHFTIPYPKEGDYYQLDFNVLSSFPADAPPLNNPRMDPRIKVKTPTAQVPESVQALDGEKISVAGFMIPMITNKDQVSSFILAQSRGSCCYGLTPKLNQWIYVEMEQGKTIESIMDIPVTVYGTLAVNNALLTENKDWCLYRMSGEKVELPKKSWF